jgi:NTP pyrophosphatase (non-canonical NTP hydrolase)
MSSLTFDDLREKNRTRCLRWHPNGGVTAWSASQWGIAMAGEAGEVCNAIKKLNRIEDGINNQSTHSKQVDTKEEAIIEIGQEIADTIIYLDLLAQSLGLDVQQEVTKKFNRVSERYGFPERL